MKTFARYIIALQLIWVTTLCGAAEADKSASVSLSDGARPYLKMLSGRMPRFHLSGRIEVEIEDKPQTVNLHLVRFDNDAFELSLTHPDYAVQIRRTKARTDLIVPRHRVAFTGRGELSTPAHISPRNILTRLISRDSRLIGAVSLLASLNPDFPQPVLSLASQVIHAKHDAASGTWKILETSPMQFPQVGRLYLEADFGTINLEISEELPADSMVTTDGFQTIELDRNEIEATLCRGVHRATEILLPAASLSNPRQDARKVSHGELRWIDGQRVALLYGTPEQIGTAHGQLLKTEAERCIESVLHTFGTVHAITEGRWFRQDLQQAWQRLAPHIPARHQQETAALAASLGRSQIELQMLNVFPELFHCSGFAVFDSATKDGTLYHGRVLDYMTTIGLQDAATTFIVRPNGRHAFANVGYAGFTGSVSGMNDKAISLGEMGGGGEGNWDGVPMATLMRRALEECETLDEVKQLWTNSPRTCEYYYVFADGKSNKAVGVAAWPERIEFIEPGQTHSRLGPGIPDAVVLSAGSRLELLRSRIQESHGKIDADIGRWLMSRPVAMQSNLHNVLFVPARGVLFVANATHTQPAAERPYVRIDLNALLNSIPTTDQKTAARTRPQP